MSDILVMPRRLLYQPTGSAGMGPPPQPLHIACTTLATTRVIGSLFLQLRIYAFMHRRALDSDGRVTSPPPLTQCVVLATWLVLPRGHCISRACAPAPLHSSASPAHAQWVSGAWHMPHPCDCIIT